MKAVLQAVPAAVWPWIVGMAGLAFLAIFTLVCVAFRQGREIVFWPPRIGPRANGVGADAAGPVTDINGSWYAYDADPAAGATFISEAQIKQSSTTVTMELHRLKDRSGATTSRRYRYQGRFTARQLVLLFESVDRPDYIIGALVLVLDASGESFSGVTVYYDQKGHTGVMSYPFWLARKKQQ